MPVVAAFLGMIIRVYHSDHPPPHLHVQYGEYDAIVAIETATIIAGHLPPRVARELRAWVRARRNELRHAWADASAHRTPARVKPLE